MCDGPTIQSLSGRSQTVTTSGVVVDLLATQAWLTDTLLLSDVYFPPWAAAGLLLSLNRFPIVELKLSSISVVGVADSKAKAESSKKMMVCLLLEFYPTDSCAQTRQDSSVCQCKPFLRVQRRNQNVPSPQPISPSAQGAALGLERAALSRRERELRWVDGRGFQRGMS